MDITQIYLTGCFLVQLLIIMMEQHVNFYFQSILGIFIFYSAFLEVEKKKLLSVFRTIAGHRNCFPHLHLLKTVRSVRAKCESPPCLFHLSSWPFGGQSNEMDCLDYGRAFFLHSEAMEAAIFPCNHLSLADKAA